MLTPIQVMLLFDEIAPAYVKLFMQVPELRTKNKVEKAHLQQRLRNCFESIRKGLELYFCDYSVFRPILLNQLRSADPFMQAPEIQERLIQNGMRQFYDNWKNAIQAADGENEQAEQEMHRKIFSNNIHMIQRYQTQPTFESLALKLEGRGCYDGENRSI